MGKFVFMGLFVLLLGAGLLVWSLRIRAKAARQIAAAHGWPAATAVVDAIDVTSFKTFVGGRTVYFYQPKLHHRFQIGGHTYQGDRLCFGYVRENNRAKALDLMSAYTPGSWIQVRYNPHDPSDNVVELRQSRNQAWSVIVGGVLVAIGFAFVLLAATGAIQSR